MRINNFQKAMLNNKDVAWEIIKIYHPDILESYSNNYNDKIITTKDRLKISIKFDWVVIELMVQKHIKVSIGIEFQCHLMSGDKPLYLFEKELRNNKFRSWRFYDDSKFILENKEEYKYLKVLYNNIVNNILNKNKIPKPTAEQMSDYYHSD